ncbi:MAG: hypothetical protein HYV45_02065 [Candidatus Moranbacteria bacterium]|nr:hypothetical protein [Candidatus Moranbacteria bacterium]
MPPFVEIIKKAWTVSSPEPLSFVCATVLAITGMFQTSLFKNFLDALPKENLTNASLLFQETPLSFFWTLCALFIVTHVSRGNLFIALKKRFQEKTSKNKFFPSFSLLVQTGWKTLLLETLFLFIFLGIFIIISLPLFIATKNNPSVVSSLLALSLPVFFLCGIVIFFIKQYTLFYFLFSSIRLRASIELAGRLFSRFTAQSFLFGLFSFLVVILFTFFLNLVILGTVAFVQAILSSFNENVVVLFVSFFALLWFTVFYNALWLVFFQTLAAPKETLLQEKETALTENDATKIPSI